MGLCLTSSRTEKHTPVEGMENHTNMTEQQPTPPPCTECGTPSDHMQHGQVCRIRKAVQQERECIANDMRQAAEHWKPQPHESGEMRAQLIALFAKFMEFADRYERGHHVH